MKKLYESKTVWLGVLTVVAASLAQLGELPIPEKWKNRLFAVIGLLNIVLRVFSTAVPIQGGGKAAS